MTEEAKTNEEPAAAPVPVAAAAAAAASVADNTTPLTEEDLKAVEGVKERLKFFFSNANLRQDIFVRKLLTESEHKGVPVDVMMKFNTIKKLSEKSAVIIKAAKELTDLLVVDEEKSILRRAIPFTKEMMNENIPLTLRAAGLPLLVEADSEKDNGAATKKYNVSVDEIRALFEKYGEVALVKLQFSVDRSRDGAKGGGGGGDGSPHKHHQKRRKYPTGAVLIEFHKKDDLEKAAEATLTTRNGEKVEPKEKVVLPVSEARTLPCELEVMRFSEFLKSNRKGGSSGRGDRRSEDGRNKKKRERDEPTAAEEPAEPVHFTMEWKPGCVIKMTGLPENCDREAILDCVAAGLGISMEDVKSRRIYADFSRGQTDGAIRFLEPSDTILDLSKRLKEGNLKVKDAKIADAFVLEGDVEKKYWDDFIAFKTKQMVQRQEEKREKKKHRNSRSR